MLDRKAVTENEHSNAKKKKEMKMMKKKEKWKMTTSKEERVWRVHWK